MFELNRWQQRGRDLVRELERRARGYLAILRGGENGTSAEDEYRARMQQETDIYKDVLDVNLLPPIFHYWSNKYLKPMLEEYGFSNPDQLFSKYLAESAQACGDSAPAFVSIGAGNCDTEVRVAQLLRAAGLTTFTIECLDMNPHMLERGREMAAKEGVAEHIVPLIGDFNHWRANKRYAGIMANQSLHHVLGLESLFDEIKRALKPRAYFVTSDMIGRNGHQRWPEALTEVHRFWQELPDGYRYNQQAKRHEQIYINFDCSKEGFEGIRAQDIVPLLVERFQFHLFIGFANVVDVFIDRGFGHNFNADGEWDRAFIDRLHAFDEAGLQSGKWTPTHMMAVMTAEPPAQDLSSRGITPRASIRRPIAG